ncbi:hypothetical protein ATY30_12430 [Sinorhizobium americanum]|nr:hypothetical protein CO664_08835 [Sinorhizobium sp. NG07B]POH32186.1 hypothetical protein ATY30_12430 [Sinorhizobium americanum]
MQYYRRVTHKMKSWGNLETTKPLEYTPTQNAREGRVLIRSCGQSLSVILCFGLVLASVVPAKAASPVELDTRNVAQPAIASALREAYQLPLLIEGMRAGNTISANDLESPVEHERTRLKRVMVELGYLDAQVALDRSSTGLVLRPSLGKLYTVAAVLLKGVKQQELDRQVIDELASIIDDYIGQPASAQAADNLGSRILYRVGEIDFALAQLSKVEWIRSGNGVVTALVHLEAGPRLRFGTVTFDGLRRLRESEIKRLIPFRPGERYERGKVEEMRERLKALSNVDAVNIGTARGNDATLDLAVRLQERPANPSLPQPQGTFGLVSGVATLTGLAIIQIATSAGISPNRLRPVMWMTTACALTFAGLAIHRLAHFL